MDMMTEFSENERRYIKRFLQQDIIICLKDVLQQSRQNGHYKAFLNAHNLEEEKEYTFQMSGTSNDAVPQQNDAAKPPQPFSVIETLIESLYSRKEKKSSGAQPYQIQRNVPGE